MLPYATRREQPVAPGSLREPLRAATAAVLVPTSGARADADMLAIIGAQYPGREVVAVPGAVLAHGGGGVHCITQQVPAHEHDRRELLTAYDVLAVARRACTRRPRPPFRVGARAGALAPRSGASTATRSREVSGSRRPKARASSASRSSRCSRVLRDRARRTAARRGVEPEALPGGPTYAFAAELAAETGAYVHASLYERRGRRRPRLQHRDRRRARRRARRAHAQAAPPGDRGLLRGPLLPARRHRLPRRRSRSTPRVRLPDVLGPVVPRGRARVRAARRRRDRLPDRDRIRARPSRLRHRAALGAGDPRERHRERHVHGRAEPHRHRRPGHVLRLVVHQRSVRSRARAGAARSSRPCSSPTSTSTSAATGSSCSRSSRPAVPTPTACSPRPNLTSRREVTVASWRSPNTSTAWSAAARAHLAPAARSRDAVRGRRRARLPLRRMHAALGRRGRRRRPHRRLIQLG